MLGVVVGTMLIPISVGIAQAQEPTPVPTPSQPPNNVDCRPLSVFCGLQVGPFGPFEFFPGGSVFPPQPS